MSCGPPLVPERVSQVVDERKKAEKRVSDAEQELAEHIARDLAAKINSSEDQPLFKFHLHRVDDTSNALGFLSSIAFALSAAIPAAEASRSYLIALSSSPSTQTAASISTVLVLSSNDSNVKAAGDELKAKLGVKGGGKGPRWSGKFTGVWKAGKEDVVVQDVLDNI